MTKVTVDIEYVLDGRLVKQARQLIDIGLAAVEWADQTMFPEVHGPLETLLDLIDTLEADDD